MGKWFRCHLKQFMDWWARESARADHIQRMIELRKEELIVKQFKSGYWPLIY